MTDFELYREEQAVLAGRFLARDATLELIAEVRRLRGIVRDLAAKPAPRTVTMLGPTCGLCGGALHSMVNPKPDMHSVECPHWRAGELVRVENEP